MKRLLGLSAGVIFLLVLMAPFSWAGGDSQLPKDNQIEVFDIQAEEGLKSAEDDAWEDEDWEEEEPFRPYDERGSVTPEELLQEAKLLQESGHGAMARRFTAMAHSLQKPDRLRNEYIRRYASPLMNLIT